jgi:predicted DNA-binding transcriptional regulator YafY
MDVFNLALDRIQSISPAPDVEFIPMDKFNPETWFNDAIGVTKDRTMKPKPVRIWANAKEAPYIRTKPFHKSQMVVEVDQEGNTIFQMDVILNPELERDILSFGEGIKVLAPKELVDSIARRIKAAAKLYE